MAYWLMKSEPDAWSWDMQVKKGDRAFFYHSNVGKEIVGLVEVIREHHPDPTAKAGEPWVVVDIKATEPMPKPVTLDAIKTEPKLKDMALIKLSRLSVQPVTDTEWKTICKMGGL
jgi:predicted RNA-binding protein with PUA-like domain